MKARPLIGALNAALRRRKPCRRAAPRSGAAPAIPPGLRPRPAAGVFTSLRVTGGRGHDLARHLARLDASTRELFGKHLPPGLQADLGAWLSNGPSGRLRLTARPLGGPLQVTIEVIPAGAAPGTVALHPVALPGGLGEHKWADRRLLASLAEAAGLAPGPDAASPDHRPRRGDPGDRPGQRVRGDRRRPAHAARGRQAAARGHPGRGAAARPARRHRHRGDAADLGTAAGRQRGVRDQLGPGCRPGPLRGRSRRRRRQLDWRRPGAAWAAGPVTARLRAALASRPARAWSPARSRPGPVPGRRAGLPRPGRPDLPRPAAGGGPARSSSSTTTTRSPTTWPICCSATDAGSRWSATTRSPRAPSPIPAPAASSSHPVPAPPTTPGVSVGTVRACAATTPLLGICLGHQAIAAAHGARIAAAPEPVHGQASLITHDGGGVLAGLPRRFRAARYHSLIVEEDSLPA